MSRVCRNVCVSVRALVWLKYKYSIEKEIILSGGFDVTLTAPTKGENLVIVIIF